VSCSISCRPALIASALALPAPGMWLIRWRVDSPPVAVGERPRRAVARPPSSVVPIAAALPFVCLSGAADDPRSDGCLAQQKTPAVSGEGSGSEVLSFR
jgi:hypothetical protein